MRYLIGLFIGFTMLSFSNNGGEKVLREMYNRYRGNWYRSFTFNQTTEQYRKDSLVKTSTWYEAIVFPDKFRIDFGERKDSNAVIYLKDSVYAFRKGKLMRTSYNDDNLTFLLGGMYFYSFDSVKAMVTKMGYDISKSYEDTWKGKPVYVIGANNASEKTNQLWIDKEKMVVMKFIKYADGNKEEGIFSGHKQYGKAWSETACDFYINDKLLQKEIYHDCKANVAVDESMFDPAHFVARPQE